MVAAAIGAGTLVAGLASADAQRSSANKAAGAQQKSAEAGIAEQQRQFDSLQKLLQHYSSAGLGALNAQQNLLGLNGNSAQQNAINGIQNSAQFQSMLQQGNNSILQNASATGGLRGGNTQAALSEFSPQLLNSMIQQQFANLGGITSLGQNAAAGQGNAGMQSAGNIAQLLQQSGAAQAGGFLAQGKAQQQMFNSIGQGLGAYYGVKGGF